MASVKITERSTKLKNDSYRWRIEVQSDDAKINKVTYALHPTFNPPSVTIEKRPFALERVGWGTFDIKVTISIGKSKTVVVFPLKFKNHDKSYLCKAPKPKQSAKKTKSPAKSQKRAPLKIDEHFFDESDVLWERTHYG